MRRRAAEQLAKLRPEAVQDSVELVKALQAARLGVRVGGTCRAWVPLTQTT